MERSCLTFLFVLSIVPSITDFRMDSREAGKTDSTTSVNTTSEMACFNRNIRNPCCLGTRGGFPGKPDINVRLAGNSGIIILAIVAIMTEIDTSILTSHHLFRSLNDAQMNSVLSSTRILNVAEGETLFHQGDKADHFYLVVSGNVKLFRSSVEGNEKIIQIVRKNQVFAEGVMFMEQAGYPVNAAIISDCQLYQFSNTRFLELLSNSHDLCLALFGDLCNRLHQMLNEVDRLSLQNARFRIIQYLDDLMQGEVTSTIVLDIDKKTIASRLSITPETLSRMLRELSQQGLISMEGKKITVHDRNRLKTLA